MADLGALALAALAFKALSDRPAASAPPPPPKTPDAPNPSVGGADAGQLAGELGGAAGAVITGLLGALGGGGGAAGAGGGGTAVVATTTGAVTGGTGGAAAGGSAAGGTVGGAFIVGSVTAGGVFAMAWAALYIAQFVAIALIRGMQTAARAYRDKVNRMNSPLLWLHDLECALVEQTLDDMKVRYATPTSGFDGRPDGDGSDDRLEYTTRAFDETLGGGVTVHLPRHRKVYANPFAADPKAWKNPNGSWRYLQMAARLVASRYVVELGKYARGMIRGAPNLGGANPTALAVFTPGANAHEEIWSYPLVGGGQPDKSYADFANELRAYGEINTFTIDDVLKSAKLAALIQCVSVIACDPSVYPPNNAENFSSVLYYALGLSGPVDHIWLNRTHFDIDPAFYKVPCTSLWLDIDDVKRGLPAKPFSPNGAETSVPGINPGVLIPTISGTCLYARPLR